MRTATIMAKTKYMKYWKFFENVECMNQFFARKKGLVYYCVYSPGGYRIFMGAHNCKRVH